MSPKVEQAVYSLRALATDVQREGNGDRAGLLRACAAILVEQDDAAAVPSLRDRFAGRALEGLCANPGGPVQANSQSGWGYCNCNAAIVAAEAFALADAMLKARQA